MDEIDETIRKLLLNMPEQMRRAWEAQWWEKGKTLEDAEAGIRRSRFILHKTFCVLAVVVLGLAFLDWHWKLEKNLLSIGAMLLLFSVPFLQAPHRKRQRFEGIFKALKHELQVAGLYQFVERGYDYRRIRQAVDDRLVSEARKVFLAQEEILCRRHDDSVSEDVLLKSLQRRSDALFELDRLRACAESFGLEPADKSRYFERAREELSKARS